MAYNNPTLGSTTTVVDCQKQVRSWRLLRSLIETLIPCCFGNEIDEDRDQYHDRQQQRRSNCYTGTIFGHRRGKVSFCVQNQRNPNTLLLLIELAVSTQTLAREMSGGILRIALESTNNTSDNVNDDDLLSTPVWTMYCNGRRVGYAVKRRPTEADSEALRLMDSGGASGAGVIRAKNEDDDDNDDHDYDDDEIMYLRAKFERFCGSPNSESFHLIDDRCIGQELSLFFYRSH